MVFYTLFQKKIKKILQGGCTQKRTKKTCIPPRPKLIHTGHIWERISSSYSGLHLQNVRIAHVQIDKFHISLPASLFFRFGFQKSKI